MDSIQDILTEMTALKKKQEQSVEESRKYIKDTDKQTTTLIKNQRNEHYNKRLEQISKNEQIKRRQTEQLFKELEKHSFTGPFFDSLLNILSNHQGKFIRIIIFFFFLLHFISF